MGVGGFGGGSSMALQNPRKFSLMSVDGGEVSAAPGEGRERKDDE